MKSEPGIWYTIDTRLATIGDWIVVDLFGRIVGAANNEEWADGLAVALSRDGIAHWIKPYGSN